MPARRTYWDYLALITSSKDGVLLSDLRGFTVNLSTFERLTLIRQAELIFSSFSVHLPSKRAMHAVDPVRKLTLLRSRITERLDDEQFHNVMRSIFIDVRDLHTNYRLP